MPVFVSSELAGFLFFPNSDGLRRKGAFGRPGDGDGGRAALGFWRRGRRSGQVGAGASLSELCVVVAGAGDRRRRMSRETEEKREVRREEEEQ